MSKVKYLGTYSGPSYYSYDREYAIGFDSLEAARDFFRCAQAGFAWVDEYRENEDSYYVLWSEYKCSEFPGTTDQDTLTLSHVTHRHKGMVDMHEGASYQITRGPRGGAVLEKW